MEGQEQTRNNTVTYCGVSEARDLASVLLTCYAGQAPAERQGYIATVAALFANYPYELVKKAVAPWGIPTDHPTYLPTVGEIAKWLDKKAGLSHPARPHDGPQQLMAPRRTWNWVKPPGCAFEDMVKKHGRPIGQFEKAGDRWNQRIGVDSGEESQKGS